MRNLKSWGYKMGVRNFSDLKKHLGHKLSCVSYNGETLDDIRNVAIECEDCNEVLVDYDQESDNEIYDHIGTVTKADFLNDFKKKFVDENFEELAHSWFRGMESQVDFGIILEVIKDQYPEGLK